MIYLRIQKRYESCKSASGQGISRRQSSHIRTSPDFSQWAPACYLHMMVKSTISLDNTMTITKAYYIHNSIQNMYSKRKIERVRITHLTSLTRWGYHRIDGPRSKQSDDVALYYLRLTQWKIDQPGAHQAQSDAPVCVQPSSVTLVARRASIRAHTRISAHTGSDTAMMERVRV